MERLVAKKTTTKSKTSTKTKSVSAKSGSAKSEAAVKSAKASKSGPAAKPKAAGKTKTKSVAHTSTTTSNTLDASPGVKLAREKTAPKSKAATHAAGENRFKVTAGKSNDGADREPLTEDQLRKVKSGLSKKDLAAFRDLLMQKRAEIRGDVESLRADAKNIGATISYEHMADTGSDNYEQEFTLGLVESERQMLQEIDDALMRIDKGYYGICIETGQPINRARLEAKPWARYCIEVAREKERHAAPRFRA